MSDPVQSIEKPSLFWPVLTSAVAFGLFAVLVYFAYTPQRPDAIPHGTKPPVERKALLAEHRLKAREAASSYEWIDQANGAVKLPIERAMELTVRERGGVRGGGNGGSR